MSHGFALQAIDFSCLITVFLKNLLVIFLNSGSYRLLIYLERFKTKDLTECIIRLLLSAAAVFLTPKLLRR
jgi:hypothetical protein